MDVSTIITKSRRQTGTTVGQKTDDLMLDDLNTVYFDIFQRLATKSKKYTRQTYKTTPVIWQNEYQVPKQDSVITGLKRVLNIQIKYTSDWDFIPCKMYDSSFPVDTDYEDYDNPYCVVRDDSFFVYPAPTVAVTDWLVVEWQYIPLPLESDTESQYIKLSVDNHDVLLAWLNMWNWADKQLLDKKEIARQEYEAGILRIIDEWADDIDWWYETSYSEIDTTSQDFLP